MPLQALAEAFPELFDTAASRCFIGPAIAALLAQNPDVARLKATMGHGVRASDPVAAVTPAGVLHWGTGLAGGANEVHSLILMSAQYWHFCRQRKLVNMTEGS